MNDQLFTVVVTMFSGLALLIGFFCSFLLSQIFNSIRDNTDKLVSVLSRLEGLEEAHRIYATLTDEIKRELSSKCDKITCPIQSKGVVP